MKKRLIVLLLAGMMTMSTYASALATTGDSYVQMTENAAARTAKKKTSRQKTSDGLVRIKVVFMYENGLITEVLECDPDWANWNKVDGVDEPTYEIIEGGKKLKVDVVYDTVNGEDVNATLYFAP